MKGQTTEDGFTCWPICPRLRSEFASIQSNCLSQGFLRETLGTRQSELRQDAATCIEDSLPPGLKPRPVTLVKPASGCLAVGL